MADKQHRFTPFTDCTFVCRADRVKSVVAPKLGRAKPNQRHYRQVFGLYDGKDENGSQRPMSVWQRAEVQAVSRR